MHSVALCSTFVQNLCSLQSDNAELHKKTVNSPITVPSAHQDRPFCSLARKGGMSTFIVAAKRTPFGSFGGKLKHLSATDLGVLAAKATVSSAGVDPAAVNVRTRLNELPRRNLPTGS